MLSFREKGQRSARNGAALPFFSVNTEEEAKQLLVFIGSLGPDKNYYIQGFAGTLEALKKQSERVDRLYKLMVK